MGFLEVLTVVFVVLKLLGIVSWSWFLVFLPVIISVAIYIVLFAMMGLSIGKINRNIKKRF